MLAVRDDELSVGDDEDTSEACEKKTYEKTMHEKHARKNMREKTCEKKHVGKNKGEKTLREKTCEKKHVRKNMCARCQRR